MDADDAERRNEEWLALSSIYTDAQKESDGGWRLPLGVGGAVLEVFVPTDYPSHAPPMPLLHCDFISDARRAALADEMLRMYDGAEVVFGWVEFLRESLSDEIGTDAPAVPGAAPPEATANGTADGSGEGDHRGDPAEKGFTFTPPTSKYGQRVRHFGPEALDDAANGVEIVSGPSFHPPKSGPAESFQAHVATVTRSGQVQWVLATLLRDKRVARATHNMIAYRFTDETRGGVQVSDNDDDGEAGSGAKLAAVLELTHCNNVIVVVSRWFGGVLLGPARFKYIASTARALLEETGRIKPGGAAKKR